MATLYFKIGADYENVIRLRDEIKKLENQLRSFGKSTPETQIRQTEERLANTRQEFVRLTTEAAKAGAVMESDFKKKIYDASQTVNDLSEKIIAQRTVVREVQADVKRLGEAYRTALKTNPIGASGKKAEYDAARKALDEERAALFGLTQEQANARLSVKKLRDEYSLFKEESGDIKDAIGDITGQMKNWIAGIAGGIGIKEFLGQMIQVRGEFENIETSLRVLLGGDSEKLSDIMSQMKEYALISPLTTKDMASALQMMIGFGIQAEDAITYLKALGDISMGDTVHFNSLALAFSQMSAAGKLMGQDLNQMINAGFNPLQQISEKTGKSIGELKDEMSKGAISAQMVQQAFIDATSAGGKFYGMAAEGAKTINGQISMLQESVDNMFNDMGQASEGIILSSIQAITELVENYDKVGAVIIGLVTAYGTYKAALLTLWALEQARNGTLLTTIKNTKLATAAQNLFNKTVKAHPYALIASLAIGAAAAIYSLAKQTNEATASQEALSKVSKKADEEFSTQAATIDRLNGVLKSETASLEQKREALNKLQSIIPDYNASLNKEGELINNNTEAIRAYLVQLEKQIKLKAAQEELEELYRNKRLQEKNVQTQQANYDRTRKQNPIGVVYGGDAGIEAQRQSLNRIAEAEKSLKDANDELKDTQTQIASIEKEIEQTSLASSKAQKPTSSLSNEIKNASEKIRNLKKEISGLRSGNIKADAGKTVEKTIEAKVKELQATEKTLETLTGKSNKTSTRIENQRKKSAEERKKAQEEIDKELLAIQQKNQDDEIALMQDGTQKRLAEIKNDYAKRMAEIDRQEAEFKKKNEEAGITGLGVNGLTQEQQTALQEARDNAAKEQERQTNEIYLAEAQAMRDYLKQYGTFQQQKLAIAEEYAEKIANAQSDGERLSLEKEREQAVANVNLSAIRQDVDWAGVFSKFGTMFQDEIERNLDALRDIMKSDEFKAMSPTDQAQIVEAVDSLREQVTGDLKDVDFKKIGELTVEFQNAQRKMIAAQAAEAAAYDNLKKAQADYEQALRNGTAEEQVAAKERLDMAKTTADGMSAAYKGAVGEFNATGNNLKDATDNAVDAINSISSAISQIKSGSLSGAFEGVKNLSGTLGKSLSNMSGLLGKAGNALSTFSSTLGGATGEIVGAVLGLLDLLKDGLGSIFADLSDLMFGAVNGILDDILSGGIITKPVKSLVDGVGGILDTITFGGFSSWTSSSNAKEVQATIDRLTDRNESLQSSIEALNDTIKDSNGAIKSVDAAEQAKEYQQEVNQNYLEMAKAQAGYHGSHHSWNYYWRGFSQEQIDKLSEQIGRDWNGNLWDLSPEEMKILKGNVDMWTQIQNTGKGGYGGRLAEKLDDYIDQAGKLEEIENTLNETLTQISFDSVYDSFIDTLMDMEASAEDFADDFSEYMMRAMLSDKIGTMFKDRIQEWYTDFAEAMKDGVLTDDELKQLRKEWDDIAADATAERDKLAEATGYDSTSSSTSQQQASSKGFETMSQDMAGELSGRFTALNETGLRIEAQGNAKMQTLADLKGSVAGLEVQAQGIYNIADETRNILADSYLELQEINENTGYSAKYLKDIKADIAIVKQNTSRI